MWYNGFVSVHRFVNRVRKQERMNEEKNAAQTKPDTEPQSAQEAEPTDETTLIQRSYYIGFNSGWELGMAEGIRRAAQTAYDLSQSDEYWGLLEESARLLRDVLSKLPVTPYSEYLDDLGKALDAEKENEP